MTTDPNQLGKGPTIPEVLRYILAKHDSGLVEGLTDMDREAIKHAAYLLDRKAHR